MSKDSIVVVLDAGGQYSKLIDRCVRELSVETIILPLYTTIEELKGYGGIIISGGPESVYAEDAPKYDPKLFELDIPILGICYGMQLMNFFFKGDIKRKIVREDGVFDIQIDTTCPLFLDLPNEISVLLTHGDSVEKIADGFRNIATSVSSNIISAIANEDKKFYGVQFHPEVDLTIKEPIFTMSARQDMAIKTIQKQVSDDHNVLVLVSGGVDSSVCAALLLKAIGPERVFALHIDNGFMRYEESKHVVESLKSLGLQHFRIVNAQNDFNKATTIIDGKITDCLENEENPEAIRKIIGDTFMKISNETLVDWKLDINHTLLCQGTLRPDLIESASSLISSNSCVIKTHHNDTTMVRALRDKGNIIEPLKDYHKDEARMIGIALGLDKQLVWRQPFPGPGLAIRIISTRKPYITKHDNNIIESFKGFITDDISVTLLPCRTVGVQGDSRTYSSLACLTTANKPNWKELIELAKIIPRTVHHVNRVIYAFGDRITSLHLNTITPTLLSSSCVNLVRQADHIVNEIFHLHHLERKLSQCPVVLFPVDFGIAGSRGICIRPFITSDFMTGLPAIIGVDIPEEVMNDIVYNVLQIEGISRVCIDLTAKPPATTEWL